MVSVGIDLGGHTISAAAADSAAGRLCLLRKKTVPTPESRRLDEVAELMAALAADIRGAQPCRSVGIGVPGFVGKNRRSIMKLTNFPIEDENFVPLMEGLLASRGVKADVYIENDANCTALGEGLAGAARGLSDYAVFTLGTGIGSGIVSDGRLLTGAHGIAGEAGHVATASDGECACGGRAHAESAAGADAIERAALKRGLPASFKELWNRRTEPEVEALLETPLDAMARCIASVTAVTDPELVILNGGVSRAEGIAEILRSRIMPYLPLPFRKSFRLEISKLGGDAALYGAASLGGELLGQKLPK
jgi:glucokinase